MFAKVHSTAYAVPHFDAFGFGLPSPSTVSLLMASALHRHPLNVVGNESSLGKRPAEHANSREFGAKFSLFVRGENHVSAIDPADGIGQPDRFAACKKEVSGWPDR